MTIETPIIRIAALLGVLVVLGAATFVLLVVGHSHSSSATPAVPVHHPVTAKHSTATTPSVVRVKPKPARPVLLPGLPAPIVYALNRHPVVVFALYERGTDDGAPLAEARAGASLAHTHFVALDVLRRQNAGALAGFTGTLAVPEVIVVRRPGVIVKRLAGYQDREVVAQAALDVR
jgi:hypothetical protein